jgi:hypothetical protein
MKRELRTNGGGLGIAPSWRHLGATRDRQCLRDRVGLVLGCEWPPGDPSPGALRSPPCARGPHAVNTPQATLRRLQVGWEAFGVMHDHNLKDDGANIAVTSANRKE